MENFIYLTLTILDISYAVGVVNQFMHALTMSHLEETYCILRYLKKSPHQGLLYGRWKDMRVEAFIDADWIGFVDDWRSTSTYCTFVGGNLIAWHSKK